MTFVIFCNYFFLSHHVCAFSCNTYRVVFLQKMLECTIHTIQSSVFPVEFILFITETIVDNISL